MMLCMKKIKLIKKKKKKKKDSVFSNVKQQHVLRVWFRVSCLYANFLLLLY